MVVQWFNLKDIIFFKFKKLKKNDKKNDLNYFRLYFKLK